MTPSVWSLREVNARDDDFPERVESWIPEIPPGGYLFLVLRKRMAEGLSCSEKWVRKLQESMFHKVSLFLLLPPYHGGSVLIPIQGGKISESSFSDLKAIKGRRFKNKLLLGILSLLNRLGLVGRTSNTVFLMARKRGTEAGKEDLSVLPEGVLEGFSRRTGCGNLTVSVFPGHRKCLFAFYGERGNRIAFGKMFHQDGTFPQHPGKNEARFLRKLRGWHFRRGTVPSLLFEEEWKDRYFIALSSYPKLEEFSGMTPFHLEWVVELFHRTAERKRFLESGYRKVLDRQLNGFRRFAGNGSADFLENAVAEAVGNLEDREVPLGIAQREFPYHHARRIGGENRILVLDWELAEEGYPPYFDLYHCLISSLRYWGGGQREQELSSRVSRFFTPNRALRKWILAFSRRIGVPFHLSYYFFILYWLDQISIHLAWDSEETTARQTLWVLNNLISGGEFRRDHWLGGWNPSPGERG